MRELSHKFRGRARRLSLRGFVKRRIRSLSDVPTYLWQITCTPIAFGLFCPPLSLPLFAPRTDGRTDGRGRRSLSRRPAAALEEQTGEGLFAEQTLDRAGRSKTLVLILNIHGDIGEGRREDGGDF